MHWIPHCVRNDTKKMLGMTKHKCATVPQNQHWQP
jgi:hypothetical protein